MRRGYTVGYDVRLFLIIEHHIGRSALYRVRGAIVNRIRITNPGLCRSDIERIESVREPCDIKMDADLRLSAFECTSVGPGDVGYRNTTRPWADITITVGALVDCDVEIARRYRSVTIGRRPHAFGEREIDVAVVRGKLRRGFSGTRVESFYRGNVGVVVEYELGLGGSSD